METSQPRSSPIFPALFLIGFSSVIAQIVLMRELIVVYNGNEISIGVILASWLWWTAIGSVLFGRIATRLSSPQKTVAGLELLVALSLPLSIMAIRGSRLLYQALPGETLGPGPMFVTSFLTLSVLCFVSGALFSAGSRLHEDTRGSSTTAATGSVYLIEAAGSGIGGIIASLVLIRAMSAFEIALLVSILNIIAAWSLTRTEPAGRRIVPLAVGLILASVLWPVAGRTLESLSSRVLWRGFDLIDVRNSIYGNLAVVATGDIKSVYGNGTVLFSVPDREAAEEAVHFALLQHKSPQNLLLIGGGTGGSLREALQYKSIKHIDYVELDPVILELGKRHFPAEWDLINADPRVDIHHTDGRLFMKRTGRLYDVIIIDLPDPQTAQLNRFYSVECFEDAATILAPNGIMSIGVSGAANYISDELAEFLRCINKTIGEVFPRVTALPGSRIHFFAAVERGATTSDSNVLLERLKDRRIETQYVNESFMPFRMTPDRMHDLQTRIKPEPSTPVNRDLSPIAYYFNVGLWSSQFHQGYKTVFGRLSQFTFTQLTGVIAVALVLIAVPVILRSRGGRRAGTVAGFGVAVMGFTTIGLEVILLLGFQAVFGYVYHQLAILIAAFMTGIAGGAYLAVHAFSKPAADGELDAVDSPRPRRELRVLLSLQVAAAVSPLLLVGLLILIRGISNPAVSYGVGHFLFPALAVIAGCLGGYQFPVASRVYFDSNAPAEAAAAKPSIAGRNSNPGVLYALDLAGACVGAIALSACLIPLFGFANTAIAIAVLNIVPALLIARVIAANRRR